MISAVLFLRPTPCSFPRLFRRRRQSSLSLAIRIRSDLSMPAGKLANNSQQQINVTDSLSYTVGVHQMKFGMDYRRLNPTEGAVPYELEYIYGTVPKILANSATEAFVASYTPNVQLVFGNWSLFAQDTWNVTRSLTITYGLRWDYNTAPTSPNGTPPYTVNQVNNLKTMALAPAGTPLWTPQKDDFAPRLAVAWNARPNLVVRAGAGIFYDLGYSAIADVMVAFPYTQSNAIFNTSFPLSDSAAAPPPFRTTPPVTQAVVVDPNHVLPRTYEWNAALEQGFGNADVLTITYLGAAGRKLMRRDFYNAPNPDFGLVEIMSNGADSSYNALQVQYRHRLTRGLQALASYTWSHSIDDVSSDANYNNVPLAHSAAADRGPSDFDIRNTFAGAVSYYIPGPKQGWAKPILENWSVNTIVYARSAPPVNVVTGKNPFPGTLVSGANSVQRPNVVPGVPIYLSDPTAPGGKIINKAAFTVPVSGQGNLSRNALRGFNASQVDFTLQRLFKLSERFSLQTSADFFNIFNHPNFGAPINYMTSPQFGLFDADVERLAGQRRPERRLESAVSDWRSALDPTGAQAAVLSCSNTFLKEANDGRELEQGHRSDPGRSEGAIAPHLVGLQRGSGLSGMCSAGCRVV